MKLPTTVKWRKTKFLPEGRGGGDDGDGEQIDMHSWKGIGDETGCAKYSCPILHHSSQQNADEYVRLEEED